MLKVKNVNPIWADNVTILRIEDLDKIVELPLLESCKLLYKKNIRTIMSSCNKYNAMGLDKYLEEYEGLSRIVQETYGYGDGYAWIMIDYDSLDQDNKKMCEQLHDENKDLCLYLVNDAFKYYSSDEQFKKRCLKMDEKQELYGYRTIVLRFPINLDTTIEEVNDYFINIINKFKFQDKELKIDNEVRKKLFDLAYKYKKELEDNEIYITEDMFMQTSLKSYNSPLQEEYGIDDSSDILVFLFIIACLDLNNLLKDPNLIMVLNVDLDNIRFLYNGEEYCITNQILADNIKTIKFGDYTKGEKHIYKESELIDLYTQFDYNRILLLHKRAVDKAKEHFPGRI